MRYLLIVLGVLVLAGCEYNFSLTSPSPTGTGTAGTTITNTNTNTSTNNNDRSDVGAATTPAGGGVGGGAGGTPLPLPLYGEPVTRQVATTNATLLTSACHDGEIGWVFLDLVVRTLRAQDARWGYLCKDAACLTVGRDVIAYKATDTDAGIWIVDVINDCGGLNSIQWVPLPFDVTRRWTAARTGGVGK